MTRKDMIAIMISADTKTPSTCSLYRMFSSILSDMEEYMDFDWEDEDDSN